MTGFFGNIISKVSRISPIGYILQNNAKIDVDIKKAEIEPFIESDKGKLYFFKKATFRMQGIICKNITIDHENVNSLDHFDHNLPYRVTHACIMISGFIYNLKKIYI